MNLNLFYRLDATVIVILVVGLMMLAGELGFRIGLRRRRLVGEGGRGHFGAVQGSMLGLVALLLGFTFSLSSQRYEARRQLVMADANVLSAIYLQSSLMPDAERIEFKHALRAYIEVRTQADLLDGDVALDQLPERLQQTEALHARMWNQTRALVLRQPSTAGMERMLGLLSDAAAINRQRVFAYLGRVPLAVMVLLFAAAVIAMCAVGLVGGLGAYRGMTARVLLAILLGGTIFIILDLDQPRHGFTKIDQTPLLQLKATFAQDPETGPPAVAVGADKD